MTRIDFYVVGERGRTSADLVACRVAAKAFEQGLRVYVHADEPQRAARLDELLWTFRDVSFVPHRQLGDEDLPACAVELGTAEPPEDHTDVMINLRHPVSPAFSRFDRVVEIVPPDEAGRAAARERYRYYQERGYALETHQVD